MRAHEFIHESRSRIVKSGKKMPKHAERSLPSAHRVGGTMDRHYDLGRIFSIVASEDGSGKTEYPAETESWAGRNNTAHPYTPIEAEMLKHAYRKQGVPFDDVLKPNPGQRSLEASDTNAKSPTAPQFKAW